MPRATSRGLLEDYGRLLEMRTQETEYNRRQTEVRRSQK
jgi:hypothetical protein